MRAVAENAANDQAKLLWEEMERFCASAPSARSKACAGFAFAVVTRGGAGARRQSAVIAALTDGLSVAPPTCPMVGSSDGLRVGSSDGSTAVRLTGSRSESCFARLSE